MLSRTSPSSDSETGDSALQGEQGQDGGQGWLQALSWVQAMLALLKHAQYAPLLRRALTQ